MNQIEAQLLQALNELNTTVKLMATARPKPNLLPLFERIDSLAQQLPGTSDPELFHFIQRKSYEKARAKLGGAAVAKGSCGR